MKTFTLLIFWSAIATTTLAQFNWEHTNGPIGGQALYLRHNDDYAFFPDKHHLFRTSDGISWEQLDHPNLWPIAVHGSSLVAIQNLGFGFDYNVPIKWVISFDNGENWGEINAPDGLVYTTSLSYLNHGIYALDGVNNTLYRSQDDGMTWEVTSLPTQYVYDMWAFDDRLYVSSDQKLWRTDTNGENWTTLSPPINTYDYIRSFIVYGDNILVATEERLIYSNDDGQTWAFHVTPWSNTYNAFVRIGNEVYALGGPTGLSRTMDDGATWTDLPADNIQGSSFSLATAGGYALIGTYNSGIMRWDENENAIKESNQGTTSAVVYDLAQTNDKIWAATGTSAFDYDLQQGTWNDTPILPLPRYYYNTIATGNNGLICTAPSFGDYFYLSTDNGVTWDSINPDVGQFSFFNVDRIQIFDDVIFIFSEFDGNARSDDLGQTWSYLNIPGFNYFGIVEFNGLLFSPGNDKLYSSDDLGATWEVASDFDIGNLNGLYQAGNYLFASAAIQSTPHRHRLYKSLDGTNWQYAHDGLPETTFGFYLLGDGYSDNIFYHDGIYYLYSEEVGYYASLDSCQTWLPIERRTSSVTTLVGDHFYVGGYGGGVLRSEMPGVFGEIAEGTCYLDADNSGTQGTGEDGLANIRVGLYAPNAWYTYYFSATDTDGKYVLGIIPNPADTLRPVVPNKYVESINPPAYSASAGGTGKDFGIYLTPDITDLAIFGTYTGRPRPGFDMGISFQYKNEGTTEADATVSLKLDPKLDFLNANPPPTAVYGDSLVWEVGAMPLFSKDVIQVNTNLPDTIPLGEWVKSTCYVSSAATDETPADNMLVLCDTVVGSFDPNDKKVEPAGGLTAEEIADGKEVFYTIRFQNTGTYLAERVRITDMLDTALFWPSLRIVAASHDISSYQLNPGGLLEVVFDNINLPDSTSNEPASHGFVTFAIQRNKNYNAFYTVRNLAAIYFDFNEPIFTNEVTFTVREPDPVSTFERGGIPVGEMLIFPNPASTSFNVDTEGKMHGEGELTLFNASGQAVRQVHLANVSAPFKVEAGALPDGVYLVRLTGPEKVMSGKLVLQRSGN